MSIDDPRNHRHAAMVEDDEHPAWLELARRTEAADDAAREAEWRDRELTESPEAEASHWAGVFAAQPEHLRNVHYR